MKRLEDLNLKLLSVGYAREVGTDEIVFADVRFKTSNLKATVEIETDSYLDTETILDEIEDALTVSLESDYFEFKGFKNRRGLFELEELNDVMIECNEDVSSLELELNVRKALLDSLDEYEDEISELYSFTCDEYCEDKSLVELIEEAKSRFKANGIKTPTKEDIDEVVKEATKIHIPGYCDGSIESFLKPFGINISEVNR